MIDRLKVIVSGVDVNQLLGVAKTTSSTGNAQATAVFDLMKDWKLVDRTVAMCFDTPASNTAIHKGACVLLEKKLGKKLLHFPCRHHILELVLASVFRECMGQSSGPDIAVFKRFQSKWKTIDVSRYETGDTNQTIGMSLEGERNNLSAFILSHLAINQPRDDYRELLQLVLIFIGEIPPNGVRFRSPGAMHHARWMAKALYCQKIWLFKQQFQITKQEHKGIEDVCLFIVLVYIKA